MAAIFWHSLSLLWLAIVIDRQVELMPEAVEDTEADRKAESEDPCEIPHRKYSWFRPADQ